MGGTVPLGYDVKDRKLVVNKAEARTVVDIYRRYLRLKSVRLLRKELGDAGIGSDLLPNLPSFIRRVCSSFAPPWGVLRTRWV
jgi:hypothetical protein